VTASSSEVVSTASGQVRGERTARGLVFRGVPFAAPPVGPRRFRPPVPPAPWRGIRESVAPPRCSPCNTITPTGRAAPDESRLKGTAEDCLGLTVWTPDVAASLPTMVWIHGGGFTEGAGALPIYDGSELAATGCAVVAINYRLHALGFLCLEDGDGVTTNVGLLDQVRALEWVRENIAGFGGDPERVTVFGESAGGASVSALLAMPAAEGLFRRAILQSGFASQVNDLEAGRAVTAAFLDVVGVPTGDVESLQRLPVDQICLAAFRLMERGETGAFRPVVDGATLPIQPLAAIEAGVATGIDLMLGTCADELRLFKFWPGLESVFPDPDVASLFEPYGVAAADVFSAYADELGTDDRVDVTAAIATDEMFDVPMRRMAEAQLRHTDRVWVYRFTWPSPARGGVFGACHVLELPFLFGTYAEWGDFVGDDPPRELGDAMRAAWVRFAADGLPGAEGLPDWPRYDRDERAVMELGVPCRVLRDPRRSTRLLWERRSC
jgi:para-nitrobenzyl esterase